MRPISVTLGAAGNTDWIPINYEQVFQCIGFGVVLSSGASLTYTVQHTFDDLAPSSRRRIKITRSTSTATVTDVDHGLSVGDSVVITGSGSTALDGTFAVASVVSADSYTYTCANSGAAAAADGTFALNLRVFNHEDVAAKTDRQDGNYSYPPRAIRLNISSYSSGKATLLILQGMGR